MDENEGPARRDEVPSHIHIGIDRDQTEPSQGTRGSSQDIQQTPVTRIIT